MTFRNDGSNRPEADAVKTKTSCEGIVVPDKIKREIGKIATLLESQIDATEEVGRLCDIIIQEMPVEHGKGTLNLIATDERIHCSQQHLRDCWQYYQLMKNPAYKTPDVRKLRETKRHAIMELSRFLNTDLDEAIKQQLIADHAKKAVEDKLTVDEVRIRVSNALETMGKMRKGRDGKKGEKKRKQPPTPTEIRGDDLMQYAEGVAKYASPERLAAGDLEKPSEWNGFRSILVAVVDVAATLMSHVQDDDMGEFMVTQGKRLMKAGEVIKTPIRKSA